MKRISANVYVEDGFSIPPHFHGCTAAFVITSAGIVVIDTPYMPGDAIKLRDAIAQRGKVLYIINTHQHLDHVAGNSFFEGTVVSHEEVRRLLAGPITDIIASERAEEAARASLGVVDFIRLRVKELDPKGLPLPKDYQLKAPTITFSGALNLYVGEHIFQLIHLPGHTASHIGVYVPQEKVFFAGDNFTNGVQPSLAQSLPLAWIESLRRIETIGADIIVPGHGEPSSQKEVGEFRLFIQECVHKVRESIKQGMSKEEAARKLSFSELCPAIHPGQEMQRLNVSRLYEMLQK